MSYTISRKEPSYLKKILLFFSTLFVIGFILAGCSEDKPKKEQTTAPKNIIGGTLNTNGLHETTDNWTNMYETEFYTVNEDNKIIFIQALLDDPTVDFPASKEKLMELAAPYIPKNPTILNPTKDGSGDTGYECKKGDMHFTVLHSDSDKDGKVDTLYISKL